MPRLFGLLNFSPFKGHFNNWFLILLSRTDNEMLIYSIIWLYTLILKGEQIICRSLKSVYIIWRPNWWSPLARRIWMRHFLKLLMYSHSGKLTLLASFHYLSLNSELILVVSLFFSDFTLFLFSSAALFSIILQLIRKR